MPVDKKDKKDSSASNGSTNKKVIKDPITLPDYIPSGMRDEITENALASIDREYPYTRDFVSNISRVVLRAKQLNAGLEKKAVPEKLKHDDISLIMHALFPTKNIKLSNKTSILGIYDLGSHDLHLGVYDATMKVGVYETDMDMMQSIVGLLERKMTTRDIDDVINKVKRESPYVELTTEPHLVPLKNGIFNKKTKKLINFHEDYIFMNKIPVNYEENPVNPVITMPDKQTWNVEEWIHDLMDNNDDKTQLIWEVIADSVQANYSRGKSIWFYSESGNSGKGTLGQLIKNILGEGNYSALSVADFNHEFLKESLLTSSANIADENDVNVYIDSISDYKASITGDDIKINRKFEKPLTIKYYGTNIQMMNGLPRTQDKTGSLYRRLLIVPFTKSFTDNGERKYIKDDYIKRTEVLEYVLYNALQLNFSEFIVPQESKDLLDNYRLSNDPVKQYWDEFEDQFQWDLLPTKFLYDLYLSWFKDNNPSGSPLAKQTFIDDLSIIAVKDGRWEKKTGQKDKVRASSKMIKDEPLITEYNLYAWMNPTGRNDKMKRQFIRKATYRGLSRI